jgi:hypothetical protein
VLIIVQYTKSQLTSVLGRGRIWSVYSLALAYQVTSAIWRLAGRLPSRLLYNTTHRTRHLLLLQIFWYLALDSKCKVLKDGIKISDMPLLICQHLQEGVSMLANAGEGAECKSVAVNECICLFVCWECCCAAKEEKLGCTGRNWRCSNTCIQAYMSMLSSLLEQGTLLHSCIDGALASGQIIRSNVRI